MKDEIIVSCIKGYATRQQRQCDMAGAQCLGWEQGRHSPLSAVCHPLDLRSLGSSKNYEDSVRRRYEMEQQVAKKDSTAKRLMMESDKIKKMLE